MLLRTGMCGAPPQLFGDVASKSLILLHEGRNQVRFLKCCVGAILFAALLGTTTVRADTIYGVTGATGKPSSLYTINPTTGAATLVGPTGFSHMTGLDFDPTTGILYGVASTGFSGAPQSLVTVNKNTGAATLVALLSGAGTSGVPDISFSLSGQLYGWFESGDTLGQIDKNTGAVTLLPGSVSTSNTGLGFDAAGNLYMKAGNNLYSVDPGREWPRLSSLFRAASTRSGTRWSSTRAPARSTRFPDPVLASSGATGAVF